jgi:hypothetical protein
MRASRVCALVLVTIAIATTASHPSAQGKRMIVSQRNGGLAFNAWEGARPGTIVRLHNGCQSSNPDCTWTFRGGMIVSDRNPRLAINAWGGAKPGVVLRLSDQCQATNPDCTWTLRSDGVFLSNRDKTLAIAPSGGAVYGAILTLAKVTGDNRDKMWSWK